MPSILNVGTPVKLPTTRVSAPSSDQPPSASNSLFSMRSTKKPAGAPLSPAFTMRRTEPGFDWSTATLGASSAAAGPATRIEPVTTAIITRTQFSFIVSPWLSACAPIRTSSAKAGPSSIPIGTVFDRPGGACAGPGRGSLDESLGEREDPEALNAKLDMPGERLEKSISFCNAL